MLYDLTYIWDIIIQKQTHRKRINLWLPEAESRERENWRKVVKTYKLPVIR